MAEDSPSCCAVSTTGWSLAASRGTSFCLLSRDHRAIGATFPNNIGPRIASSPFGSGYGRGLCPDHSRRMATTQQAFKDRFGGVETCVRCDPITVGQVKLSEIPALAKCWFWPVDINSQGNGLDHNAVAKLAGTDAGITGTGSQIAQSRPSTKPIDGRAHAAACSAAKSAGMAGISGRPLTRS